MLILGLGVKAKFLGLGHHRHHYVIAVLLENSDKDSSLKDYRFRDIASRS